MSAPPRSPFAARTQAMLAVAMFALACSGCSQGPSPGAPAATTPTGQGVEPANIGTALARLPEFSGMRRLAQAGGIAGELARPGNAITLLAARDTAFAQLPPDNRARLFQSTASAATEPVLRGMMLPRILNSEELRTRIIEGGGEFSTPSMAGTPLTFRLNGDQFIVTTANGASANMGNSALTTGNGAIYILDRWIGPAD